MNPKITNAPLPEILPGGTGRDRLKDEYCAVLESVMLAAARLPRVTVNARDYATSVRHERALVAHKECIEMVAEVANHLCRALDHINKS